MEQEGERNGQKGMREGQEEREMEQEGIKGGGETKGRKGKE